jgi:hypothetical protein
MKSTTSPHDQTPFPLLSSTTAALLALISAASLLVACGQTTSASDTEETTAVQPAGGDTADRAPEDEAPADGASEDEAPADEQAEAPEETPVTGRTCYSGPIVVGTDSFDVFISVDRDGADARVGLLAFADGIEDVEVADGVVDADGLFTGTTRSIFGFEGDLDTLVITDQAISDTEQPIQVPAVACDDVAEEMTAIDEAAARIDAGDFDNRADGDDKKLALGSEPARVWSIVGDEAITVHQTPGQSTTVVATISADGALGGAGASAVTVADDIRWISVYVPSPNAATSVGWVRADQLMAMTWDGWLCYSSEQVDSVLVFDPLAPAGTAAGAFVVVTGEDVFVDEPEVRLIANAPASDAEEVGDELPVLVQVGQEWETQEWAQTSFGIEGPEISWANVPCDEVGEGLALITGFRNEIELP